MLVRIIFRLQAENLALRQQLPVYQRKQPKPKIKLLDRLCWLFFKRFSKAWEKCLFIVQPETLVKWHRQGFRLFWRSISKPKSKPGRPRIGKELRALIVKMATENDWGAPRVHGELTKLGYAIDESTVSNYMPTCPTPQSTVENWKQFLKNHSKFIYATDFFSVPTAFFRNLYILFVVHHESRRIIHVNATFNPDASWITQQFRNAFPGEHGCKYLILDRDAKFSAEVLDSIKEQGIEPSRIAPRCPWQNPYAERWVGTARRELFDRVVVFGREHAPALLRPYLNDYHDDRTHLGLNKETPTGRQAMGRPEQSDAQVVALPKVGGLHHRYEWRRAA
jgi:hypothetical protein